MTCLENDVILQQWTINLTLGRDCLQFVIHQRSHANHVYRAMKIHAHGIQKTKGNESLCCLSEHKTIR